MPVFVYIYCLGAVQPQIHFDDVGPKNLQVLQTHKISMEEATSCSLYSLMLAYPFNRDNLPKD